MTSKSCAALIFAVAMPGAQADAAFTGHWAEKAAAAHCIIVRGFDLRADGAAKVDWATDSGVERRDGTWYARSGKLHLSVVETVSDPAVLKQLGRNEPLIVETDIDGTLNASRELETAVTNTRDHNIDGAPYSAHCTFVRSSS